MTNQPTPPIFDLAASVGAALQQRKLVLATAESCTGGGISQAVTDVRLDQLVRLRLRGLFECVQDRIAGSARCADRAIRLRQRRSCRGHGAGCTGQQQCQRGAVDDRRPAPPAPCLANQWARCSAGPPKTLSIPSGWYAGDRQAVREQSVRHALQGLLRFMA